MPEASVRLTQHPVGQGGMMSGLVNVLGEQFHWVYDCGSNQRDALSREISLVALAGDLDCLFISHLDSDHVNGIDQLMAAVRVKEVVVPYLNDIDRLIAVARDASNGRLTGTFMAMLADIAGWFGARGAEIITFVEPGSDEPDEEYSGPDLGGADGADRRFEGQLVRKWSRPPRSMDSEFDGDAGRVGMSQIVAHGSSMELSASSGAALDWVLAPYAHRPSDADLRAFAAELAKAFGNTVNSKDTLLSVMTNAEERKKLRDCYRVIWSDHNLVSMAVYSGPARDGDWTTCRYIGPCRSFMWHWADEVGWLGTGDMHLDVQVRRRAFLRYYNQLLPRVNVFGLPHHGSHLNFHDDLLDSLPGTTQCVAASGPNAYGHPSKSVKQSVERRGKTFVRVNQKAKRVLRWQHHKEV